MAVFLVIAVVLVAVAVYRYGRARGSWKQWRASAGSLRANRTTALKSSGSVALLAVGAVLALVAAISLSGHH